MIDAHEWMGLKFDILTIFPDFFHGPLQHGIVRRASEAGLIDIGIHDLRGFAHDRHRTVDDRPFGGGEGMVLKPEPIFECAEALGIAPREKRLAGEAVESVILLSPQGELFSQKMAERLSRLQRIALICGRYEGVDERVSEHLADREVSVGDYVLSGGELAAAIVLDAVTRLLPGALGNENSARQESFTQASFAEEGERKTGGNEDRIAPDATCASGGLLDYPHYTRPAEFRGMSVPAELVSGNHDQTRQWRRHKALEKTLRNRPELLQRAALSQADRDFIATMKATKN